MRTSSIVHEALTALSGHSYYLLERKKARICDQYGAGWSSSELQYITEVEGHKVILVMKKKCRFMLKIMIWGEGGYWLKVWILSLPICCSFL